MTCLAIVCRVDMVGTHATRHYAVMTTHTRTNHLAMINVRRQNRSPRCWTDGMASITLITTINVIRAFPGSERTVMTTNACANNLRMIHC